MERCYFCKGRVVNQRISHIHKWGKKIVIFENINAEVCKQCGEVYFKPEVLDLIDKKMQTISRVHKTIQVPVVAL